MLWCLDSHLSVSSLILILLVQFYEDLHLISCTYHGCPLSMLSSSNVWTAIEAHYSQGHAQIRSAGSIGACIAQKCRNQRRRGGVNTTRNKHWPVSVINWQMLLRYVFLSNISRNYSVHFQVFLKSRTKSSPLCSHQGQLINAHIIGFPSFSVSVSPVAYSASWDHLPNKPSVHKSLSHSFGEI